MNRNYQFFFSQTKPTVRQLMVALVALTAFLLAIHLPADQKHGHFIAHLHIDGTINPATMDYIEQGIIDAQSQKAEMVLITMDTPGGLLNSTKKIVQAILNAPLPVVIFIYPSGASATSAGVFITMSAHVAAMASGSSIGAAHPVSGSGKDIKEEGGTDMAEKVENYASAFIEGIANKTGRNADWAIKAVRESESVTAEDALKLRVIDIIADSIPELLEKIDGRSVNVLGEDRQLKTRGLPLKEVTMSFMQQVLDILSTPNIALLLLSLGSIGILAELYHPGTYFPGVLGGIAFLLGMVSLQILPINYGGLALIALAIILFVAELFVPSFGILGVGGIISFIFGAMFLFKTPEADLSVSWGLVISIAASFGVFMVLAATMIGRVALHRPRSGIESLVGEQGRVVDPIHPPHKGKIFFHGEYWNACSDVSLGKGQEVRVVKVEGMLASVEPLAGSAEAFLTQKTVEKDNDQLPAKDQPGDDIAI